MDYKQKLAEFKVRLASVSDKVSEQNANQKAIGPGSRQAETTATKKNSENPESKGNDHVTEQNANQQEIHNKGGKKEPKSEEESAGKMSPTSY